MKINDINQITDYNHLNLIQINYQDQIGNAKQWIYASRSNAAPSLSKENMTTPSLPDAVVIIPFNVESEKLILIREFRIPLRGYQYGFPAGLMDRGEVVEETARRELKEETGLELTKILKISPPIYSSSGMTDESVSLVYAHCSGAPTTKYNEDSEDITVLMLSREEATKLIEEPNLKFDVKTWIILLTFATTGSILF